MFGRGRTGQNCSQFKIGHCKFQIRPRRPLLLLLGVKRGLLSQQFSDQFFGPINRDLVAYREQYSSIPLNRFVQFDARLI